MKKLLLFVFGAASLFPLTQPGVTQTRTHSKAAIKSRVLFDFRLGKRDAETVIPLALQRKVLSAVFTKYLTDDSKCNRDFDASGDNDPLKAARAAGQIVPAISDSRAGSFTAPGQNQVVYVISVNECNASHADNFGTKRIAIFDGSKLIAEMGADFMNSIVRKFDLNADGIDELLMTSGDLSQGTLTEMATLAEFNGGQRRVIEDFGTVVEDSCASLLPGAVSKASVVSVSNEQAGKFPKFRMDNYRSRCGRVERWRFLSTGKMVE